MSGVGDFALLGDQTALRHVLGRVTRTESQRLANSALTTHYSVLMTQYFLEGYVPVLLGRIVSLLIF
jgi:hypothetical protein